MNKLKYNLKKPFGIMFHHFHNEGTQPTGSGSITPHQLQSIIKLVGRNNIVNAKSWTEKLINNNFTGFEICLTFDDAINSQIKVALPVLEKESITAFWFIQSGQYFGKKIYFEIHRYFYNKYFTDFESFYNLFKDTIKHSKYSKLINDRIRAFDLNKYLIEYEFYSDIEKEYRFIRDEILNENQFNTLMHQVISIRGIKINDITADLWMKEEDIGYLARTGHMIGLHSFSHSLNFKSLSYSQQREEYQKNYNHLLSLTGNKPISMAHPSNSYNSDTLTLLQNMEIKFGFRSNAKSGFFSSLEYPRIDSASFLKAID